MVHSIIQCDWGLAISTKFDTVRCDKQAVQRIALHGVDVTVVQLCVGHKALVLAETNPHQDAK